MALIPTPAFAVPYAAPKQVKTMAEVQPIAPKNGCETSVSACMPSYYVPPATCSSSFVFTRESLLHVLAV